MQSREEEELQRITLTLSKMIDDALNKKLAVSPALLQKTNAAMKEHQAKFEGPGPEHYGINLIIRDINRVCNSSDNYVPIQATWKSLASPLHQSFFPKTKRRINIFSCSTPDLRRERFEFMNELFGESFLAIQRLCKQYVALNAIPSHTLGLARA